MEEKIMDAIAQEIRKENGHTTHKGAQWFPKAGLGLFVHFGVSVMNPDPENDSEISWCLMKHRIKDIEEDFVLPEVYYGEWAKNFNPQNYNPKKWLQAAKEAGFRYAVLTTRHHDGFALWPSEYGEMNTKNYMGGRDLVRPFVEACREVGMKVGLYYSPTDWYYLREYNTWDHNYCWDPYESWLRKDVPQEVMQGYKEYCYNQIKELLTNYGKIDLLWFDGGYGELNEEKIRALQPWLVINNRLGGGQSGDFWTPERTMPADQLHGWWEYCDIWNKGPWSWTQKYGEQYRPTEEIIEMYETARKNGGNLLINCAPRPDGDLPQECYKRFEEFKAYMKEKGAKLMPEWEK